MRVDESPLVRILRVVIRFARGILLVALVTSAAILSSDCSRQETEARRTLTRWVRGCKKSANRFTRRIARRDAESAKRMVDDYWKAVFEGRTRDAYRLLTNESRKKTSFDDYSRKVAFGPRRTPLESDFWKAYSRLSSVKVGPVRIDKDSAEVTAIITFPYVAELVAELEPKADSLFSPSDSPRKKDWLLGELTARIHEKRYRPYVMLLELGLHWERSNWRLVYQ